MDSAMKLKKKRYRWRFFILLDIAFLFIFVGIGILLYTDYQQEQIFVSEIEKVMRKDFLANDFFVDVQASGDYGTLEKEIKYYFKNLSNLVRNLDQQKENDLVVNLLTADNLKNDGPNFQNSFKKIAEIREVVKSSVQHFTELSTKEYWDSFLEKRFFDEHAKDLFRKVAEENDVLNRLQTSQNDFIQTGESFEVFLNNCEEILNFLSKNKGQWYVDNDSIVFRTSKLLEEYRVLSQNLVDSSDF